MYHVDTRYVYDALGNHMTTEIDFSQTLYCYGGYLNSFFVCGFQNKWQKVKGRLNYLLLKVTLEW